MKKKERMEGGEILTLLRDARRQVERLRKAGGARGGGEDRELQPSLSELASLLSKIERARGESPSPEAGGGRSQAAVEHILSLIPAACLVADFQHRVVGANRTASDLLGLAQGGLAGRRMSSLLTKECWPSYRRLVSELTGQPGGGARRGEVTLRPRNGKEVTAELSLCALRDEGGKVVAYHHLFCATGTRSGMTADRHGSLHALPSPCPGGSGAVYSDSEGRFLYADARGLAGCGLTTEVPLGERWTDLLHRNDRARFAREWAAAADQGREYVGIVRLQPAGEVEYTARVRAVPIFSSGGELAGHVATVESWPPKPAASSSAVEAPPDAPPPVLTGVSCGSSLGEIADCDEASVPLTGHTRAEESLRQSEERYRAFVEQSTQGIWRFEFEEPVLTTHSEDEQIRRFYRFGYLAECNDAMAEMYGYASSRDLEGARVGDFLVESDPRNAEFLRSFIRSGYRLADAETAEADRFGTPRIFINNLVGILEGDVVARVWGTQRDITAHKRMERELREGEEKFRQLADNIEEIFWIWEPGTRRLIYVSPAFEKIFGLSCEDLYRDPQLWERAIHPEDREATKDAAEAGGEGGEFTHEYRVVRPDGAVRWVCSKSKAVRDEDGRVFRLVGITEDITERKSVEEELKLQAKVLENMAEGVIVTDGAGHVLFINPAVENMLGFLGRDVVGRHVTSLHTPSREEEEAFARLAAGDAGDNGPWVEEISCRGADKAPLLLYLTINRIPTDHGRAWVAVLQDVTERRQAEARLREQAELLDHARDAILVRDLKDRITFWNKGAENLYGWAADEVMGRPVTEFLYVRPDEFAAAKLEFLLNGEYVSEFRQVAKGGKQLLVQTHWSAVYDNRGQISSVLVINTDVTEKRELEARLLRAQRVESIGTLAAGIAHNVNNVLAPIILAIEELRTRLRGEEEQYFLAMLKINTQRGSDLINQVLAFARGTSDKGKVVRPSQLLNEIVILCGEVLPKSIKIRARAAELRPVFGDATQLNQIILNLCLNARDAMPDGGELRIEGENATLTEEGREREFVLIRVTDTGTGIPPELKERIFQPFFTTKEPGKGTGLGLAVVADVVKAHGGFIDVESQLGVGTQFKIYFPAYHESPARSGPQEEPDLPHGGGELVLVVDDEWAVRETAKKSLEQFGYRVLTAADGEEAVRLYEEHGRTISAVILDMIMPEMGGLETVAALRSLDPHCKVIAVSGLPASERLASALRGGEVEAFLSKPFTTNRLLKELRRIISPE